MQDLSLVGRDVGESTGQEIGFTMTMGAWSE